MFPAVPNFQRTARAGVSLRFVLGEGGLKEARDAFWRQRPADDETSRFGYTRIAASLLWKEYAMVTVHRPIERRGASALDVGNGGGTYLFHRVGSEPPPPPLPPPPPASGASSRSPAPGAEFGVSSVVVVRRAAGPRAATCSSAADRRPLRAGGVTLVRVPHDRSDVP